MILFTQNPAIVTPEFILYKKYDPSLVRAFNLSSPLNYFVPLKALLPIQSSLPDPRMENAEQFYIKYIAENPYAYLELLNIMEAPYLGGMSIVLIDESSPYRSTLNELLAIAITKLYGYTITYADDPDDLYSAPESTFSVSGILAYDNDKKLLAGYRIGEMNEHDRYRFMAEN